MNITQEKVNNLKSKIVIDLKKEDYEPKVAAALKKASKQVSLKGFRPGMAPLSLVKKMHGNSVLVDELNRTLGETLEQYLQENKIAILASPIPAEDQRLDVDINNIQDVTFSYEIGHAPEFELSYLDAKPTFTKHKIAVEDKQIEEEVERIRKRFAKYEYPETVQENDILTLSFEELDETGAVKEGGLTTTSSVLMELVKPEHKAKFLSLSKQAGFEGNVFELFDRDKEGIAKNILNQTDATALDNVSGNFKITLNNITRALPADMNEEFFVKVYGQDGPKSETEMRDNIRKDLEAYFDGRTDVFLVNDLYKGVMENVDFPLPEDFLKRWILLSNEQPVTAEQVEAEFPTFAKQLRWNLITQRIAAENNYDVTREELENKVREQTIQQMYGYGLRNMGEEWVESFVQRQLKDKEYLQKTHAQLLDDKVLGYIKSKVNLSENLIGLEEFNEMVKKANAEVESLEEA